MDEQYLEEAKDYKTMGHLDVPDKPFHSKRPHRKSRGGCKNCKIRKVKCNEEHPACRSCIQRKATCVYPTPRRCEPIAATATSSKFRVTENYQTDPDYATPQNKFSSSSSSSSSSYSSHSLSTSPSSQTRKTLSRSKCDCGHLMVTELRPVGPSDDMTELRLLWLYANDTCETFAINQEPNIIRKIPRDGFIQQALKHRFLMDCILSFSAMHMVALGQEIDPVKAPFYRSRAFEGYRKALEAAKPDSVPALVACSLLFTAVSTSMFRESKLSTDRLRIVDWMVIWRGPTMLLSVISIDKMFETGYSPLFRRPLLDIEESSSYTPNNLLEMVAGIDHLDQDHTDVTVYHETIQLLGSLYMELQMGITLTLYMRILTWFTYVPERFVVLAREARPRALVIIAHFLAFVCLTTALWWMEGVGKQGILEIAQTLGPAWLPKISMPLRTLEASGDLEVAMVILGDPGRTPSHIFHNNPTDTDTEKNPSLSQSTSPSRAHIPDAPRVHRDLIFLSKASTSDSAASQKPETHKPTPAAFKIPIIHPNYPPGSYLDTILCEIITPST